jgi:uncharacterized membrane protein (DUF441 family)
MFPTLTTFSCTQRLIRNCKKKHTNFRALFVFRINQLKKNIRFMKNADRPFIGIIIVTIAVLYGIIALLS